MLEILDTIARSCVEQFDDTFERIICKMPPSTYKALFKEASVLLQDNTENKTSENSTIMVFQRYGITVIAMVDKFAIKTTIQLETKIQTDDIKYPYKYFGLGRPAFLKRL